MSFLERRKKNIEEKCRAESLGITVREYREIYILKKPNLEETDLSSDQIEEHIFLEIKKEAKRKRDRERKKKKYHSDPNHRKKVSEYKKNRYNNDDEFRKKDLERKKEYRENNLEQERHKDRERWAKKTAEEKCKINERNRERYQQNRIDELRKIYARRYRNKPWIGIKRLAEQYAKGDKPISELVRLIDERIALANKSD